MSLKLRVGKSRDVWLNGQEDIAYSCLEKNHHSSLFPDPLETYLVSAGEDYIFLCLAPYHPCAYVLLNPLADTHKALRVGKTFLSSSQAVLLPSDPVHLAMYGFQLVLHMI